MYSSPSLISPAYLSRNCGHIREVAFHEREKIVAVTKFMLILGRVASVESGH